MKTPRFNVVLTTLILAAFSYMAQASCQEVPAAPSALEENVLTNQDVEALLPELNLFLAQLESLRECIQAEANALVPPQLDADLAEGEEPTIDPAFIAATQALSDAALQVDQLEAITIERFNFLVENAQENQQPSSDANTPQP